MSLTTTDSDVDAPQTGSIKRILPPHIQFLTPMSHFWNGTDSSILKETRETQITSGWAESVNGITGNGVYGAGHLKTTTF